MPYTTLISVEQLHALIATDADLVILDCRFSLMDVEQGQRDYAVAHLPGAFYADLNQHLAAPVSPTSGRHPLPPAEQFLRQVSSWGITRGSQVVVYDAAGGAIAARAWWMLRHWLGLPTVALLDGGYPAWQQAGYALTTVCPQSKTAAAEYAAEHRVQGGCVATSDEIVAAEGLTLVDARSAARFRGEVEPIDARAGHIPGSVNRPFEQNLDAAGYFCAAEQLRTRFADLAAPSGDLVHLCGSGVTACHNILAMQVAGLARGRLYVGSWSEWLTDENRAVATGDA